MSTARHILIIEDDAAVADILREALEMAGYRVRTASNGRVGIEAAGASLPALILLDVIMPGMNGLEVCRQLRAVPPTEKVPILFLTGQTGEEEIIAGLKVGADDYIAKPFRMGELLARVEAALRRAEGSPRARPGRKGNCPIRVDAERHEVFVHDAPLLLTRAEFRLLHHLRENPGKVFARRELLTVINQDAARGEANVDVHMSALRKKMGKEGRWLVTVRGVGYKFRAA